MADDQENFAASGPQAQGRSQPQNQPQQPPQTEPDAEPDAEAKPDAEAEAEAEAEAQAKAKAKAKAEAKAEAEVDRRLLESSLVRLRATGHPLLRSMADDLLAGRVSMRELARNPSIAAPIQAAAQRYLRWRNSMSPEELKAISDDMAARVQWMRDHIAKGWRKPDSTNTNTDTTIRQQPEAHEEDDRGSHAGH